MRGVCIVTGGSRGIGAECAKRAAEAGYDVCISFVSNQEAANAVVREIEAIGKSALAVQVDVAGEADIVGLFKAADAMGPLTGLINNAGKIDISQRVDEYSAERVHSMFAVNVIGTILCAREAIKRMSTRHGGEGGAIVNIGSAAAYLGSPNQYVDYASSKAAVDTFTRGLALEVADEGIRVNAVRPGLIYTELHASGGEPGRVEKLEHMVPMKRGGSADEVARAVLWLMSEEASYVTGDSLNVTGGR